MTRSLPALTGPWRRALPYRFPVVLIAAAAVLVVAGLVMEDAGVEFGALALILAAWLVRDHARTPQAARPAISLLTGGKP